MSFPNYLKSNKEGNERLFLPSLTDPVPFYLIPSHFNPSKHIHQYISFKHKFIKIQKKLGSKERPDMKFVNYVPINQEIRIMENIESNKTRDIEGKYNIMIERSVNDFLAQDN